MSLDAEPNARRPIHRSDAACWRRCGELREQGYRLVQIGATRLPEQVELTYSFDLRRAA